MKIENMFSKICTNVHVEFHAKILKTVNGFSFLRVGTFFIHPLPTLKDFFFTLGKDGQSDT